MGIDWARVLLLHGAIGLVLFGQPSLRAQGGISVPFVGCRSDGQVGPIEAPTGISRAVSITAKAARGLSYYRSAQGVGVLGPRGWYCFGVYGSGGETLFVSPHPIEAASVFSTDQRASGPAIDIHHRLGDGSGRFSVADIIARVFPAYKRFVTSIIEESGQTFTFGPYPQDRLTYKGKTIVEYRTPAEEEGLGTHSWLEKNDSPIDGVAMLVGQAPDLLLLSVRLPLNLTGLTSAIVRQVELDAERSLK